MPVRILTDEEISNIDKDALVADVQQKISAAESYYNSEIHDKLLERQKIYDSDPDYYSKRQPDIFKENSITSTLVKDTIHRALTQIMEALVGGKDVVQIVGRKTNDGDRAKIMQELVNFQILIRNNGRLIFRKWVLDSLIMNFGVLKAVWERDSEKLAEERIVSLDAFQQIINSESAGELKILKQEPMGDQMRVTIEIERLKSNKPVLENIPRTSFLYDPEMQTIDKATFVAQRQEVSKSFLKEMEKTGIYSNIDEAIAARGDKNPNNNLRSDSLNLQLKPYLQNRPASFDKGTLSKHMLYECYLDYDVDDDGINEKIIVTMLNGKIIRVESNTYGRPPFFIISPRLAQYGIESDSWADLLANEQEIDSIMWLMMLQNIAKINDSPIAGDIGSVDADAVNDGEKFIPVDTNGGQVPVSNLISVLTPTVLDSRTGEILNMNNVRAEQKTGVSSLISGDDSRVENKTATGISILKSASDAQLNDAIELMVAGGIEDLMRHLVSLNQQFLETEVVTRLTDEPLEITPDDLRGEFDLIIQTGLGAGVDELNLQNLLFSYTSLLPADEQRGLATPQEAYNLRKQILELQGLKAVDSFVIDPSSPRGKQLQQQRQQERIQAMALMMEKQQQQLGGGNAPA